MLLSKLQGCLRPRTVTSQAIRAVRHWPTHPLVREDGVRLIAVGMYVQAKSQHRPLCGPSLPRNRGAWIQASGPQHVGRACDRVVVIIDLPQPSPVQQRKSPPFRKRETSLQQCQQVPNISSPPVAAQPFTHASISTCLLQHNQISQLAGVRHAGWLVAQAEQVSLPLALCVQWVHACDYALFMPPHTHHPPPPPPKSHNSEADDQPWSGYLRQGE